MNTEEWERAKELFSAAVAMAAAERQPFLQSQADSPETMREVQSLLAAYEESPGFLDEFNGEADAEPAFPGAHEVGKRKLLRRLEAFLSDGDSGPSKSSLPDGATSGADGFTDSACSELDVPLQHVGPYRIVRRLGEGGMGVAYLAERDDGVYCQQVAIKVLKNVLHATGLKKRFENERQVLAGLNHPYIARLIDGGTTTSEQPYYVMEYVPGESVTRYASAHNLGLRERLTLFMAICEAVAAAHRQLVIHGDIKPANILVNADGAPKLLDFGLARMIRLAAQDVTMSVVLLTPGYASPEQVRCERLSTATDIYSLGVLLFELLTGESPYGGKTSSPLELCRAICDASPSKPSATKKTAIQNFAPRQFRGDLDQIVLKALRKSPDERYATVAEMRADVLRYLNGFPVEAARGSALYHFRKFVIRRRWFVAAGTLALILASFAIWRIWHAEQTAELRFNQVRQLAHAMVFDVHDAIQDLPGSTMARKVLIERALEYLKGLEATSGHNRDLQLELARAYTKIGTVQAAAGRASLNDCAAGIQNLEHARALLRDVLERSSADEEAASALIDADVEAANVHARRGEMDQWRALRVESAGLLNRIASARPQDYRLRLRALQMEAETLDGEHNQAAALSANQQVLAAAAKAPQDTDVRLLQARTERNLAEELQGLGNQDSALDHQRAALRDFEGLLATSPVNTRFKLETSWSYTEIAWLEHQRHDDRAALADFTQAMQLLRSVAAADSGNRLARLEIGKLELAASETVEAAVSRGQAAQSLREAVAIFTEALQSDATNDDARVHLAQTEFAYAVLRMRMAHGQCSAGIDALRRALAAASAVKDDYSATSVFDMRKTRAELRKRLSGCGVATAKTGSK